jgi:curved DNA-binding protein
MGYNQSMTDHYATLGVDKSATQDQIKQAYRKLAMKHHPDRNGGDDVEFKKIQEAYDVLRNTESRSAYDNSQPQFSFHDVQHEFQDLFSSIGGFGNIFSNRRQSTRNKTLNLQTSITLTDAYTGKEFIAELKLPSGKSQVINVKIPAGVHDGNTIRLTGLGDDSISNVPRGDIILGIRVINDTDFVRQNDDLIKSVEISMWDAALGSSIHIETIDKKLFDIKINAGTQHSQILAIPNAGMPNINNPNLRGRMLLKISVKIPTFLTDEQRQLLEQAKQL